MDHGWDYPDGKKGVRTRWADHYDAMLPDDFYTWDEPKRKGYIEFAKKQLGKETARLSKIQ